MGALAKRLFDCPNANVIGLHAESRGLFARCVSLPPHNQSGGGAYLRFGYLVDTVDLMQASEDTAAQKQSPGR
jgi:hypothetical protein